MDIVRKYELSASALDRGLHRVKTQGLSRKGESYTGGEVLTIQCAIIYKTGGDLNTEPHYNLGLNFYAINYLFISFIQEKS